MITHSRINLIMVELTWWFVYHLHRWCCIVLRSYLQLFLCFCFLWFCIMILNICWLSLWELYWGREFCSSNVLSTLSLYHFSAVHLLIMRTISCLVFFIFILCNGLQFVHHLLIRGFVTSCKIEFCLFYFLVSSRTNLHRPFDKTGTCHQGINYVNLMTCDLTGG